MARCGRATRWGRGSSAVIVALVITALLIAPALAPPAHATLKYGPIQLSGSVDSQSLFRSNQIDEWQFIQNRNTALFRLDYDWLENGKLVDRYDVPFIKRSNLYILYRGVYDSFWGIAPGGRQKGVTKFDDIVGGPIIGNRIGSTTTTCKPGDPVPCSKPGIYSRIQSEGRNALAYENTLREAYIDLALADAPLSFRIGRQQVIWGESDQFRLMDVINPLDTTWHLQQEDWDKLRIPLWLFKAIWDMGDIGPIANAFTEVVWNPGDYQPGNKIEFLPAPWAIPVPDPTRAGQIQLPNPNSAILLSPIFNLQGTSVRKGDFNRNPADASDIGVRFHGVTDIPLVNMQGFEFTANYLYARGRAIGAQAGAPFGLKISKVVVPASLIPSNAIRQDPNDPTSPLAAFAGRPVYPADVTAEWIHPYTHIFGMTANWFEGNYTNTVFRMEQAYQLAAPFQSAFLKDRPFVVDSNGKPQPQRIPLGFTKRDIWAGMVGFDRPTWIKFLNPRTTWFITGQFFWSYVNGSWSKLRGGILTAGEDPYFTPPAANPLNAHLKNGVGLWNNGQFAGQEERTQSACNGPSCGQFNTDNGNADKFLQWETLFTLAATSFYAGGTIVPFVAIAIDPFNRNFLAQLKLDYFLTNDLIIQLRENFYNDLGSGRPSLDPWGAGGLNARRDETGIKVTLQF
jgi:hypothetical protein